MQSDGPGSELAITHHDRHSLIKALNEQRRRKGLPLLDNPDKSEKESTMAQDTDLRPGIHVATPHGVGKIEAADKPKGGWNVRFPSGVMTFYHAWEIAVISELPKTSPPVS